MHRLVPTFIFAISTSALSAFGQGPTLTGLGYADPARIQVAPGQVTTLFMTGLNLDKANPQRATALPLPTSLAGISVTLNQSKESYLAPLLVVQQLALCSAGAAGTSAAASGCLLGAITLQIPWELSTAPTANAPALAEVMVSQNGIPSEALTVSVASDNLHVVTSCDLFPSSHTIQEPQPITSPACGALVTHANGDLVTADDPAQPGEEIVIWAFGLGPTTPTPRTGGASPTPAAASSSLLYLRFDFRLNAGPSRPYVNPLIVAPVPTPVPIFAGLTPGQIGLYQINVRIPSTVPTMAKCGAICGPGKCTMYNAVQSNLTIDIGASASFDGAPICVQPPQ